LGLAAKDRVSGRIFFMRGWIGSILLLLVLAGIGGGLVAWKKSAIEKANAAAANHPEPMEAVTAAVAKTREYRRTTTSIGTVRALRSVTLRNEMAGTVKSVMLEPGQIVEEGAILVALDVSVEEAELKVQEAQASLSEKLLLRIQEMQKTQVASPTELDRAKTEREVALAQIARAKAIIARKTIRAPFKSKVGLADVHPGQYLEEGTILTTLQGVDDAVHVDFTVAQRISEGMKVGDPVEVASGLDTTGCVAKIVAIDARVDVTTRNAMIRARVEGASHALAPGASVRVRVPIGDARNVVVIPASALRKGPSGDHVFVISADKEGQMRAYVRPVQSGAILGDEVVIDGGLTAGEQVAAAGSFKLREGVKVVVAPETAANVK
jgi:membrane fusion protein (multidrug efflux system)